MSFRAVIKLPATSVYNRALAIIQYRINQYKKERGQHVTSGNKRYFIFSFYTIILYYVHYILSYSNTVY